MCMSAPSMPAPPELPPQMAAAKAPDRAAARASSGTRATDRMRSSTPTILTSGSGVSMMGDTAKKTLLGQ